MDGSSRPPRLRLESRWETSGARPSRRVRWLALVVGSLALLIGITSLLGGLAQPVMAHNAPRVHFDASPTDTPTATPPANPPTLALVAPDTGQGPVGAHLTLTGANWGTDDVLVGAAAPGNSCADPNAWTQTFNHVRPQADQTILFTFYWPTSLAATGGPYAICASNSAGSASTNYQVLSASPPTLTLNPTTVAAGSLVKVTLANFVGSGTVTLTVKDAQGKTRELTTVTPDGSGNYDLQYQPKATDVGDVTLTASTAAPQGIQPAIRVSAKLHVDVAPTPTVATTPTTVVAANPPPKSDGNSSALLIVALVVGILLLLLAVAGAVFYFVMRGRNTPSDGPGYDTGHYGGSNPGFGGGVSGPGYGRPGGVFSNMNQGDGYGAGIGAGMGGMGDGGWDSPTQGGFPMYEQPDYGAGAGGWGDPDAPDPNWRPRPMTGQWGAPPDYSDTPFDDFAPNDPYAGGQHPPQDPWGAAGDSYGSYGGGQGFGAAPDTGRYPPSNDPRGRSSGGGFGRSSGGGSSRGSSGAPRDPSRGRRPDQPPNEDW